MSTESIFLSVEEIRELTGYRHSSGQCRWLSSHGWQFEISRIGRPIVGRDYARQKTGLVLGASGAPERRPLQMNLAAIQKKVKQ